jgi:REP-associated tyrosine transposase
MPRPPRLELPGVPQHVIQRGNNRASCFFVDADRRFYLKCLSEAAARRGCELHAYVLMSNHVHLLVTPCEPGAIGAMMQDVGRRYVRVINTIHGRTGTLWESRFRSSLVDSETYLLTCHKYIELNPVRAGLVSDPGAYAWSSHAHYLGDRTNRLITEHPVYLALGGTKSGREAAFRSFVGIALDDALLDQIRIAINTDSAVGSESFLDEAEGKLGRSVRPPTRGRPAKIVTGKLL